MLAKAPYAGQYDQTYDLSNGPDNNFVEIILVVLCSEVFDQLGKVNGKWLQRIHGVGGRRVRRKGRNMLSNCMYRL